MKLYFSIVLLIISSTLIAQKNKKHEYMYVDSITVSKYRNILYPDTSNGYSLKMKKDYTIESVTYSNIYFEVGQNYFLDYKENGVEILYVKQKKGFWVWNLPEILKHFKCNYLLKGRVFYGTGDDSTPGGYPMLITEIRFK